MPNYVFKCSEGHITNVRLSHQNFDFLRADMNGGPAAIICRKPETTEHDGPGCEFLAFVVIQPVQFRIKL